MRKLITYRILAVVLALVFLPLVSFTVSAQEYQNYAPKLYFEGEETYYPVSADYFLANSQSGTIEIEGNIVSYYDLNDGVLADYQNKLKSNDPTVKPTVYYRIDTSSGSTIIQYWMFYVFNPGEHNQHEGDWEMVEVVIPPSGLKWVGYSQHYSGQRATWDLVEKDRDHIKVYVARGSHANYLRPYSGKLGIASDIVGDNGKVLTNNDYDLVELSTQTWLNYDGLWGDINSAEDFFLGKAGPQGLLYRTDMNGNYMKDGESWGSGLMEANGLMFQFEWFLYNFIWILILASIGILSYSAYKIFKRHKTRGLGPRVVSMLYIDGLNLSTIGNILCFVGIIIAIFGLYGNWYKVSASIDTDVYQSSGMTDIISVDGINGMNIFMPTSAGPVPMGSVAFPFAIVLLVSFIFMVISTIGVFKSSKLGFKYVFKGIKLILVVVVLIVVLMLLSSFTGFEADTSSDNPIGPLVSEISSNPAGGSYIVQQGMEGVDGSISFEWGLGMGSFYLVLSGIVFIAAGILEIVENKDFFKPKIPLGEETPKIPVKKEPAVKEIGKKAEYCPECGKKLDEGAKFCHECGGHL